MIETEIKGDGDDSEGIPLRASMSNNQADKIVDSSDECYGFKNFKCQLLIGAILNPKSSSACSNASSSSGSLKDGKPMCRICHSNSGLNKSKFGTVNFPMPLKASGSRDLITPCKCNGTLKMVHRNCLERWVRTADTKSCEVITKNIFITT